MTGVPDDAALCTCHPNGWHLVCRGCRRVTFKRYAYDLPVVGRIYLPLCHACVATVPPGWGQPA